MSDIKLFRLSPTGLAEIPPGSTQVEKSLQKLVEKNLEQLLGIRFLASEYSTGKVHRGRIDTLGIDENSYPVIIEYKRAINENVINQGLFYIDWLMDHQKEFQWLVKEKLGDTEAGIVEWSNPRLLCIAGDFTRYDEHAIKQIERNIELIRYRRYGNDILLLELINAVSATPVPPMSEKTTHEDEGGKVCNICKSQDIEYRLSQASSNIKDLFEQVKAFLLSLGDDVEMKMLQNYFAFKRIKNFACVEVYPTKDKVTVFLKIDPTSIELENGFSRDVRAISHFGTGDLEVTLHTAADLKKAEPLLVRSYEGS